MVDGLDTGDGVKPDAFVCGVQAGVGDAEAGGRGDSESCEVVADVRRTGDLGFGVDAERVRGLQQGGAQPGVGWESVERPAGGELDKRGTGVGTGAAGQVGCSKLLNEVCGLVDRVRG